MQHKLQLQPSSRWEIHRTYWSREKGFSCSRSTHECKSTQIWPAIQWKKESHLDDGDFKHKIRAVLGYCMKLSDLRRSREGIFHQAEGTNPRGTDTLVQKSYEWAWQCMNRISLESTRLRTEDSDTCNNLVLRSTEQYIVSISYSKLSCLCNIRVHLFPLSCILPLSASTSNLHHYL